MSHTLINGPPCFYHKNTRIQHMYMIISGTSAFIFKILNYEKGQLLGCYSIFFMQSMKGFLNEHPSVCKTDDLLAYHAELKRD